MTIIRHRFIDIEITTMCSRHTTISIAEVTVAIAVGRPTLVKTVGIKNA